jgi:hypothetical protein
MSFTAYGIFRIGVTEAQTLDEFSSREIHLPVRSNATAIPKTPSFPV